MEYVECHGNCRLLSFSVAFSAQGKVLKAACQCAGDPQHSLQPAPGPPLTGFFGGQQRQSRPMRQPRAAHAWQTNPQVLSKRAATLEQAGRGDSGAGRFSLRSNSGIVGPHDPRRLGDGRQQRRAAAIPRYCWPFALVHPASANTADQSGIFSFHEMLHMLLISMFLRRF